MTVLGVIPARYGATRLPGKVLAPIGGRPDRPVEGEALDATGLLVDFGDMRDAIKSLVHGVDHQFLNDLPPFDRINPSAENLARYFCDSLKPAIQKDGLRIQAVTVWETDTSSATFRP